MLTQCSRTSATPIPPPSTPYCYPRQRYTRTLLRTQPRTQPNLHLTKLHAANNTPPPPVTTAPKPAAPRLPTSPQPQIPWQQRVLNTILSTSAVPYSSFVALPITFLHRIDARVKQIWLVTLFLIIARASPPMRFAISGSIALTTVLNFPQRLWASQLQRLGILCAFLFTLTAIGSDSVPPLLQPRSPPASLSNLPPVPPLESQYSYVIFNFWFITITRRSVNLAITAATLTFTALQSASLCLVTTPGEEMAMALRWFLHPLRFLGVKVNQVALTLLLSLRFLSLVFEEVRNLCLGLASRGVDWKSQGSSGTIYIFGKLFVKLFANLFQRSENIAQAMVVRGFRGPDSHHFHMMRVNPTSVAANVVALLALGALCYSVIMVR